jgi:uncharacterized membrane protein
VVSFLWGGTNPFLKDASTKVQKELEKVQNKRWYTEQLTLLSRIDYLLPLILNLCGSSAFYYFLKDSDLSIAVPVSNTLTFMMTTLVGKLVFDEPVKLQSALIGTILITVGTALCSQNSMK